jgi:hypothetical protein
MSDTPQPFGWAYRDVGDQDISPNWFLTKNEDWINRRAASGRYVIKPVYTTPPPAPAPGPVKESVTAPPARTLREVRRMTDEMLAQLREIRSFAVAAAVAEIDDWRALDAAPSGPDPAPVTESVTVPRGRTLREEAAIRLLTDRLGSLAQDLTVLLRHHRAEALEEAATIADQVQARSYSGDEQDTADEIARIIRALKQEMHEEAR